MYYLHTSREVDLGAYRTMTEAIDAAARHFAAGWKVYAIIFVPAGGAAQVVREYTV